MNKIVSIGLGVSAVVVALLVGAQLFGSPSEGVGTESTPSPAPSVESTPLTDSEPAGVLGCCVPGDTAPLQPGPFVIWDSVHGGYNVTVTVPNAGWTGAENQHVVMYDNNIDPPGGAGVLFFQGPGVPSDPCAWRTSQATDTGDTVEGYLSALAMQASQDPSESVDVVVAGHPGKAITLVVPDDVAFSECDQGLFVMLTGAMYGEPLPFADRGARGPGQIDEFWIVDAPGNVVIFDITYGSETPQEVIDDLRIVVASATFGATSQ